MGLGQFLQIEDYYCPLPLHITTMGRFSAQRDAVIFGTTIGFSGGGWAANNRAVYVPVSLPRRFTVAQFFSPNATNSTTGNVDYGLYDAFGARLVSTGTTSRAGNTNNTMQYVAITPRSFPPGKYYLAVVFSSTSAQVFAAVAANLNYLRAAGVLQEDLGSTVLPVTMTPASYASTTAWCFGFSQSATL